MHRIRVAIDDGHDKQAARCGVLWREYSPAYGLRDWSCPKQCNDGRSPWEK